MPLSLIEAVKYKNLKIVQTLITQLYAKLDIRDQYNTPILILAVCANAIDIVQWLLYNTSVNINAKDAQKKNALMHAASQGNIAMVELLIKAGAEIRLNSQRKRESNIAKEKGYYQIAEYLLVPNLLKKYSHPKPLGGQIENMSWESGDSDFESSDSDEKIEWESEHSDKDTKYNMCCCIVRF